MSVTEAFRANRQLTSAFIASTSAKAQPVCNLSRLPNSNRTLRVMTTTEGQSVTAPSEALLTSLAYLARTPFFV